MAFEALPFDALASEVLAQGATLPGGTGQSAGTTTGNTTVLRAAVRSLRPLALWGPVPDPLLA
ncbi:hypothetical protein [Parafrankia discariae]|uniref:hypothetical protein n=1 Tax=Parafrankia discariae TaxID=365528 RepID=UPI0003794FAA|nr:hypothetical protein [Parafrankia discariae]